MELTTAQDSASARAEEIADLLAEGMRALLTVGDLQGARKRFELAYELAEKEGGAEAMAEAALGLAGIWVHEHRTAAASVLLEARLRKALSLLDPRTPLGLRLRIRLAAESGYRLDEHGPVLELLEEARQTADPQVRAEALSLAHHTMLGPDHHAVRRAMALELIEVSLLTRRRIDLLMGVLWQAVDLLLLADPHADRRLAEVCDLLEREEHLAVAFVAGAIDAMLAIRAGDFDRAEDLACVSFQRGAAAGDIDAEGWHGAQLVAIRWYQGRIGELLPMLDELVHSTTLSAIDNAFVAALAVAAAAAGDRRKAMSALAILHGEDLGHLPRSSSWLTTMAGVIEAAALLDDRETAARAYELLEPYAHLPMIASLGVVCFGSTHYALGLAALTVGDLDAAVEHLSAAVQQNLALKHWPAVELSRRCLARALRRRGRPEDVAQLRNELADADPASDADTGADPDTGTDLIRCAREGWAWRISLGERSILVKHSVGMFHLAVLIANPLQEIRAADLAAGLATLGPTVGRAVNSVQPVLDHEAVQAYRRRLEQLPREIEEHEERGALQQAARARKEREWLEEQLSGAMSIGGRPRAFTDESERARIAVGKAIRRALDRITAVDPEIGGYLRRTVRTGVRCSYWPG